MRSEITFFQDVEIDFDVHNDTVTISRSNIGSIMVSEY